MRINRVTGAFLLLIISLSTYGVFSMMTIKPLDSKWDKLFRAKADVITEYSRLHAIHLKNTELKHHDLSLSHLINDSFENVNFEDSIFQNGSLTNITFSGGTLYDTSFGRSTLTNVVFENMIMEKAIFVGATLVNVTFNNCKIYNSHLHNLVGSKFIIEDSELNNVEFFDSEMDITLKNTKVIEQGKFSGLKPGSRVTLEDSYIGPYSSFKYSNIASFKAVRSELDRFSMGESIGEMTLENSKLDFTLGDASIDRLIVTDCEVDRLSHSDALIKHASISNCKNSTEVFFIKSALGDLNIRDCDLSELGIFESKVSKINIANSKFIKTVSPKTVTKEFILHNVTFLGETDFKGAQADDTELFKVTFAPSATLDATGSNIPFKQ
jgi:uncharacterized protein YjbI with pentapeptide repeats